MAVAASASASAAPEVLVKSYLLPQISVAIVAKQYPGAPWWRVTCLLGDLTLRGFDPSLVVNGVVKFRTGVFATQEEMCFFFDWLFGLVKLTPERAGRMANFSFAMGMRQHYNQAIALVPPPSASAATPATAPPAPCPAALPSPAEEAAEILMQVSPPASKSGGEEEEEEAAAAAVDATDTDFAPAKRVQRKRAMNANIQRLVVLSMDVIPIPAYSPTEPSTALQAEILDEIHHSHNRNDPELSKLKARVAFAAAGQIWRYGRETVEARLAREPFTADRQNMGALYHVPELGGGRGRPIQSERIYRRIDDSVRRILRHYLALPQAAV